MRKLSILIIIIGVLVFCVPIIGKITTNYLETKMVSDWQNGTRDTKSKVYQGIYDIYNKTVDAFSVEKKSELSLVDKLPSKLKKSNVSSSSPSLSQEVVGIIKISKIDVNLPIVEGINKQNLRVGIGHFPETAKLGTVGNCALAGHRSYALGHFFNRLDELVIGDEITIVTKKGQLKYKVFDKFVVLPQQVSVLNNIKNDSIITLITCTPIRIATHRLIVVARLE